MFTQREKNILNILENGDCSHAKQISHSLGVSEKTIRNDILSINYKFGGIAQIVSKPKAGYHLEITDQKAFFRSLHEGNEESPSTPEQRVQFILRLFLKENRYIKTEEIANMLYQSASTISADLKEVRRILKQYHCTLQTRPKYGMRIEGEEKYQRQLGIDLFYKNNEFANDESLEQLTHLLHQVLDRYPFQISEFAFNNLVIHLSIAIKRIRQGKLIAFPDEYVQDLASTLEYTIALDIVREIRETLDLEVPESECAYIAMHLLGKKLHINQENTVIPQKYTMLIQHLLGELSQEYKFDFTKDLNLQLALTLHLIPLSYRLKYDLRMENPLLDSIKQSYPHAYIISKSLANGLSKAFNKAISPDEIGYLALHIHLSMEKEMTNIRKKNILLVCATGKGTARLLEYQYRQKFNLWINKLICCDVSSLKDQDFSDIDFIFTTVPIYDAVPVPVIETGFILDQTETVRIEQNINDMSFSMVPYFPKELFFNHVNLKSQQEVIRFLIQQASARYSLPDNFEELVWKREELFSTAFDNNVALPHPYKPCTKETFASVAILDKPILWNQKPVQVVFMISLSQKSEEEIQTFYGKLSKLLVNTSLLNQLIENRTYEFLMETFDQIKL